MDIRIVLVPVSQADHGTTNVEAAFEVGKALGSHVTGLHVRPDPRAAIPYIGEGMTADVIQELCDAAERDGLEKCARAKNLFERIREQASVPLADMPAVSGEATAGWTEEVGDESHLIAACGRVADLSVMGRPGDMENDGGAGVLEGTLFRSGRPVLVVPANSGFRFPGTVGIAWNGSAEAARAVAYAQPFIAKAEKILVISAGEAADDEPDVSGLIDYLAWHGVAAEAVTAAMTGDGVGGAVLAAARNVGADLLVMGAYTHSRWREMILGGVTRYMLANTDLPLLMAH